MEPPAALRAATAAFLEYDCGQKGHLMRYELRAAHLALFGWNLSSLELDALLPKPAAAAGARMELADFCTAMVSRLLAQDPDELVRRHFRAFDVGCKGYISLADLKEAMRDVAPHLPHATTRLVFSQIDSDGDGRVSYADFHAMLTAPSAPPSGVAARTDAALRHQRQRAHLHATPALPLRQPQPQRRSGLVP